MATKKTETTKISPAKKSALKEATIKKVATKMPAEPKTKPSSVKGVAKKQVSATNLHKAIVAAMQNIKANDIISMDLSRIDDCFAKQFIICHGDSKIQAGAIAQNVMSEVRDVLKVKPFHHEGLTNKEWMIIDYIDIVVHVFYRETREYYQLERLWSDAKVTKHEYKK